MRLLELHIRNIASIEKADIDFEHDLLDPDSGHPAQCFLICGDTGSGKTVLLDGISLALFKTSPRLADSKGRQHNAFVSKGVGDTNVFGIEQYTRLGITPQDECYSEVVFESNDGCRCCARLELGLTRNNTYRAPRWSVQVGDAEPVIRDCDKIIEKTIGMKFDQFKHVAMLAQGDFARFLCGERDERSKVLERLTDTAHFSRYGQAIRSLYSSKKNERQIAAELYRQASVGLKDASELERLRQQQGECSEALGKTATDRKLLDQQLERLKQLHQADEQLREVKIQQQRQRDYEADDTFRMQAQLCAEWDATVDQRPMVERLSQIRQALRSQEDIKAKLQQRLEAADAYLMWMTADQRHRAAHLDESRQWIEGQQPFDALFSAADLLASRMQQLSKDEKQMKRLGAGLDTANKQLPTLQSADSQLQSVLAVAKEAVKNNQDALDLIQRQLDELQADGIPEAQRQLNSLSLAYDKLADDYREMATNGKALQQKEQEESNYAEIMKKEQERCKELIQAEMEAKKRYEEALSRFTTMNASLDDTLVQLRQRMSEHHADHCPLCGQNLPHQWMGQSHFETILTPLRQEQEACHSAYEKAQGLRSEAEKIVGEKRGLFEACHSQREEMRKALANLEENLRQRSAKAGLPKGEDPLTSIERALGKLKKQQEDLLQRQNKVEALRLQQRRLLDERKSLDDTFDKCRTDMESNQRKLNETNSSIASLKTQIEALKQATEETFLWVDNRMVAWNPRWHDDIDNTYPRLIEAATAYRQRKEAYEKDALQLQNDKAQAAEAEVLLARLRPEFPQWQPAKEGRHRPDDTAPQWDDLATQTTTLLSQQAVYRQQESDLKDRLADWERQSGMNVDQLRRLMENSAAVEAARRSVQEAHETTLRLRQSQEDGEKRCADLRRQLKLDEKEPLPDTAPIAQQLEALRLKEEEQRNTLSQINADLSMADKQQKEQETLLQKLRQAEAEEEEWGRLDTYFGGDRFRNVVQTYILTPLLKNANQYLTHFSDRYTLTCSEKNEQLAILVLDRYNRDEVRSATVLSGGERFMISLALSLALSTLVRSGMNVNMLFIDEGFGTLGPQSLDSVMRTLGRLATIPGQGLRRVGMISHREELLDRIPNKIQLVPHGEGRSRVEVTYG